MSRPGPASRGAHRQRVARAIAVAAVVAALAAVACSDAKRDPTQSSQAPPWSSAEEKVAPRPGMVWIPKGTLLAGTPKDRVPRVPDAELAGDEIALEGFYIDVYPHPNEPGAIPTTNVTRDVARELCERDQKRLCTELEIERACKGADNFAYPYGSEYRFDVCGTGKGGDSLTPNGFHAGCASAFGVHDTHGTVWFWTSSDYARGTEGLAVVKGGNSQHGELVGRCAHVRPQKPETPAPNIGVRCCAGPENSAKVVLDVARGTPLQYRRDDTETAARFEQSIHALTELAEGKSLGAEGEATHPASKETAALPKEFHVERVWLWHPLGNEELYVAGGCAQASYHKQCGAFVGRDVGGSMRLLVFVSSDRWQPTLGEGEEGRVVHVMGGDDYGAFRKPVAWEWGKVTIFGKERKKGRRWVVP
ncbi:MAG: SUMF1/EgtB/PvdO family nonheme iron enzyme [Polyangiaceae bacterium]|nr:SUMF1/EgtB/PvdO family nonheme iron enzyme [Polyangiaceae bacterium]